MITARLSLLICCVLLSIQLFAQTGSPFDFIERKQGQKDSALHSNTTQRYNPFDLTEAVEKIPTQIPKHKSIPIKNLISSTDKENFKANKNFLFWLLLFVTALMAIAININTKTPSNLIRSFINPNYLQLIYRNSKGDNELIHQILYFLYFIGLAVFTYLAISFFGKPQELISLLWIFFTILGIYAIRHISLRIVGHVFELQKETHRYLFSIMLFGSMMSLFLIPVSFVIAFISEESASVLIIICLILFGLLYLFRQFREIFIATPVWKDAIFQFFVYLCACEIAPLVLIFLWVRRDGMVV